MTQGCRSRKVICPARFQLLSLAIVLSCCAAPLLSQTPAFVFFDAPEAGQ